MGMFASFTNVQVVTLDNLSKIVEMASSSINSQGANVSLSQIAPSSSVIKVVISRPKHHANTSDMDAICLLLDSLGRVRSSKDLVSSGNARSLDGSVECLDSSGVLNKAEDVDLAVFKVNLAKVNPEIKRIVFAISVPAATERGQTATQSQDSSAAAVICITDNNNDQVLARYELDNAASSSKYMTSGEIYRSKSEWFFRASGDDSDEELEALYSLLKADSSYVASLFAWSSSTAAAAAAAALTTHASGDSSATDNAQSSKAVDASASASLSALSPATTTSSSTTQKSTHVCLNVLTVLCIACAFIFLIGVKGGRIDPPEWLSSNLPFVLDTSLDEVRFSAGWDATNFGNYLDVDLWVGMSTNTGERVSHDVEGAMRGTALIHSKESRTGYGDGDDEVIDIFLSKMSQDVERVDLVINIFEAEPRLQTFGQVSNAYVRVFDPKSGRYLANYDLSRDALSVSCRDIYLGSLIRDRAKGGWRFLDLGVCIYR